MPYSVRGSDFVAYPILVLGGYGNFGEKIASTLAGTDGITVIAAGRDQRKVDSVAKDLSRQHDKDVHGFVLDIDQSDFARRLAGSGARLVIHTSGPFQGQNYHVAEACIESGIDYIDLADARGFVRGFEALDARARENSVTAISGASTVPGLSSAVLREYVPHFEELKEVHYGIAPGNRADRGEATVKAILSYTGRPFKRWQDGSWEKTYGWQEIHRHTFPNPVGRRWLASCDIPDLDLFPKHYPSLRTIKFYAGLELSSLHIGMWLMSWLARLRVVGDWARFSRRIYQMSRWFDKLGTDVGGMYVQLSGSGHDGKMLRTRWNLVAEEGHGPQIPTIPSVILAKKLANGTLDALGAKACMGLFSLEEFFEEVNDWNVWQTTDFDSS